MHWPSFRQNAEIFPEDCRRLDILTIYSVHASHKDERQTRSHERPVTMSNTAANLSSSFFHMSATVAGGFKASSFGVVNAAGTHAIGRDGVPSVWATKRVAREIAPYIADCDGYEWVRIYPTQDAAKAGG